MWTPAKVLLVVAIAAIAGIVDAHGERTTVCTITVNSADEKAAFRRNLPEDKFRFVELVERNRPDWLASACRQDIRCDVLIISGHFDGVTDFYSDAVEEREYLPVREMERVSCSNSCPNLFSHLKEVYMFGCNSLNPEPVNATTAELSRVLARSGASRADSERLARELNERYGESSRDRMRRIFVNVPAIHGFSSVAPLGPTAAGLINRYFHSGASRDFGKGRINSGLLNAFSAHAMAAASGMRANDPLAGYRSDVCQFFDERLTAAPRLAFVHELLRREGADARMHFERIEQYFATLTAEERSDPAFVAELEALAADRPARDRYLALVHSADPSPLRARMIELGGALRWLTPVEQRAERMRIVEDIVAGRTVDSAEVDLVCALNRDRALDAELGRMQRALASSERLGDAAVLACLGSADARAQVLRALSGAREADGRIAQAYLAQRPVTDVVELRALYADVTKMPESDAQVRAFDTLARQQLSDPQILDDLARLLPQVKSVSVQRAIAGILLRSDYRLFSKTELVRVLREYRRKSPGGGDLLDVLLRRLEAAA
jgi:hypothetical protein